MPWTEDQAAFALCKSAEPIGHAAMNPQTESAHISVRYFGSFNIDQTDVSVCRLRLGYRTGRRTVILAIGIEAVRPRPEGAWFTRARLSSRKTKGSNLKYSGR